jgi:Uma2 family endonuclease
MTAMPTPSTPLLPHGRPLTYDDLAAIPDDGHRYELVDGVLIVTPSPVPRHQLVVGELHLLLRAAAPAGVRVFFAPLDVKLTDDTVLQPDLLVVRQEDVGPRNVQVAPLLAVEVLSPSTRLVDLNLKRARYEQAGCPAYWVVDPQTLEVVAWELRDGTYAEVARVGPGEVAELQVPFAVTLRPEQLGPD